MTNLYEEIEKEFDGLKSDMDTLEITSDKWTSHVWIRIDIDASGSQGTVFLNGRVVGTAPEYLLLAYTKVVEDNMELRSGIARLPRIIKWLFIK